MVMFFVIGVVVQMKADFVIDLDDIPLDVLYEFEEWLRCEIADSVYSKYVSQVVCDY